MTESEKLNTVKIMTGETDEDLLQVYLTLAGDAILHKLYPFRDDIDIVPVKYHMLQCQIANFLYQKRGAEGEISHSENGITRAYTDADIPQSMLKQVVPFLGVI